MKAQTRDHIIAHARAEFPRECCGLIVNVRGHEVYRPARNLATGSAHFILHPDDYAAAEDAGDLVAVVHSHPNASPQPSQADRVACENSGLPWHIVGVPSETWATLAPSGYVAPLYGREFAHGVLDCYALIRDWYAQERSIALPDFERTDEWWSHGQNLYRDNFARAGFEVTGALHHGAVLLMQINSRVPNHAAVYLDGQIAHHLMGRLSCRDVWGGYWEKSTTHILRYAGDAK